MRDAAVLQRGAGLEGKAALWPLETQSGDGGACSIPPSFPESPSIGAAACAEGLLEERLGGKSGDPLG